MGKLMKGHEMKFDIEYIEKLSKVLADNELTEISLEDGEQAITIRKDMIIKPAAAVVPTQTTPADQQVLEAPKTEIKKGTPVVSPMVGTFYSAPSPDAEPFVTTGKTVTKGDKVCIIEAMKLMNEIETEVSGKVLEICAEDGQPVEYGQVLMYIEEKE